MRVLFLNIYLHPDLTGTGKLLAELARDLVARGHEVTVVTSLPHYGREQAASGHGKGLVHVDELDGIRILRTSVWVPKRVTFVSRVVNYLSFTFLARIAGLRAGPTDVVVSTWPITVGFSAWIVARLRAAPFVLDVQDIVPEGLLRNPAAAFGY